MAFREWCIMMTATNRQLGSLLQRCKPSNPGRSAGPPLVDFDQPVPAFDQPEPIRAFGYMPISSRFGTVIPGVFEAALVALAGKVLINCPDPGLIGDCD